MGDTRLRFLAEDVRIRVVTADTTQTTATAQTKHQASPTTTAALGRTITSAALLGSTLKDSNILTVFIDGDGPAGRLVATCDAEGNLRGYVQNPRAHLPPNPEGKLDVASVVGRGQVVVSYDLGLGEPYSGSAPLVNGEIGADIAYYLTTSEQIPSAVGVGVLVSGENEVEASGGFMVQALPTEQEEDEMTARRSSVLQDIAQRTSQIDSISRMIARGATPEALAKRLTEGLAIRQIAADELRFHCRCDRHRSAQVLRSIKKDEIEDIVNDEGYVEVNCEFCRSSYRFNAAEVEKILSGEYM